MFLWCKSSKRIYSQNFWLLCCFGWYWIIFRVAQLIFKQTSMNYWISARNSNCLSPRNHGKKKKSRRNEKKSLPRLQSIKKNIISIQIKRNIAHNSKKNFFKKNRNFGNLHVSSRKPCLKFPQIVKYIQQKTHQTIILPIFINIRT